MFKNLLLASSLAVLGTQVWAGDISMTDTVYEIAIQEVKPGQDDNWSQRRSAFLKELDTRAGNEKDWTFPAFFTFPEPGPNPVYVGITRWSTLSDFSNASKDLMPTPLANDFFETINLQAFVQAKPIDGSTFVLEDHINSAGQVLEVAVRRPLPNKQAEFDATRDDFFNLVAEQPGYIFDQEFVTTDGWQAVLIGWDSMDKFQSALGALSQGPEMGAFFSTAEILAYQASVMQ